MSKSILISSLVVALTGATAMVYAAPKPPSLLEPLKNDIFSIKKPIKFSWLKVKNVTKYRLIISNNAKFTNYDTATGKCAKNTAKTCFSTTTQSPSYTLPAKNSLLQTKGGFFWQVQAIGGTSGSSTVFQGSNLNNKNAGEQRPFSISETLAIPKVANVAVEPRIAAAGSLLTFNATLTTELLDGYVIKIDFGDGDLKMMEGAGVDYSYATTFDTVGEDQNFTIAIFDANDEEVDSNGDSFTITADGTPVIEPPVTKPDPVKPIDVTPTPKPVTVPHIASINVLPASLVQGESLTFSADLSGTLPSGYSVKVDYGNGLFAMSGSGTSYSFNATPLVSAAYSIGVYDAKNVLKSTKQTGNFSVNAPAPVNVAPTLNLISGESKATVGVPYTIKLSASDSDGNLSSILVSNWGDGASDSPQSATNGATLSFTHTFTTAGSFTWNASAYDSNDAASAAVSKTVTVATAPVVVTPPVTKTTGYSKIANDGSVLSDSAKLGTASTDWACTKDNKTGLIWEVKTDDDGLRDKDWHYTWYEPDSSKNGGFEGYPNKDYAKCAFSNNCNTYAFTNAVNAQSLCGASDWRMPTIDELLGIVKSSVTNPSMDTAYFPDIKGNYWFLSFSSYANNSDNAWLIGFDYGNPYDHSKSAPNYVRLVR